jgi:hypothetical protein
VRPADHRVCNVTPWVGSAFELVQGNTLKRVLLCRPLAQDRPLGFRTWLSHEAPPAQAIRIRLLPRRSGTSEPAIIDATLANVRRVRFIGACEASAQS